MGLSKRLKMYREKENLCLKKNDFQENASSAFGTLRGSNEFADVTLACEDGQQVEAHKVILASSSPFFLNLLRMNKHPHPLIYMRGLKSDILVAILDFIYCGEANIYQENLNSFLSFAEDLKLKAVIGLGSENETEDLYEKHLPEKEKQRDLMKVSNPDGCVDEDKVQKEHVAAASFTDLAKDTFEKLQQKINRQRSYSEQKAFKVLSQENVAVEVTFEEYEPEKEGVKKHTTQEPAISSYAVVAKDKDPNFRVSADMQNLDDKVTSMLGVSVSNHSVKVCQMCGKEGPGHLVKQHIEAKHIKLDLQTCNICGKDSKSRRALEVHNTKYHKSS